MNLNLLFNFVMLIHLLLLFLNSLFVAAIENCTNDECDDADAKLLTQIMQFVNKNHNLTLHVLNISERVSKLETQNIKYEEKIDKLEQKNNQLEEKLNKQTIATNDLTKKSISTTTASPPPHLPKKNCVDEADSNWIVIQRRKDGSVNFFRDWDDYKEGFGHSSGEFFMGLNNIHHLTDGSVPYELLIEMETFGGEKHNASYDHFVVGSENEKFKLKNLGRFHGTAGDSLNYHLHQYFSTKDRRNDQNVKEDCAKAYEGGWWYNECHQSNLNGHYYHAPNTQRANGIHWYKVTDYNTTLKFVEMKIRPRVCKRK